MRLVPVSRAAKALRAFRPARQLGVMRLTVNVWNPLYDRLVDLWCRTVDGELPFLDETGVLCGGRPGRQWPTDWAAERDQWLGDYERASLDCPPSGRHAHARSNFSRLHRALLACPNGSDALSAREVGWIRRALANTVTRHGAPGSARRCAAAAAGIRGAAAPDHAALAEVLARWARRLAR